MHLKSGWKTRSHQNTPKILFLTGGSPLNTGCLKKKGGIFFGILFVVFLFFNLMGIEIK